MNEKFYSVSAFAKLVNVSVQSIYQRMKKQDDDIQKYIKLQKGKKVISEKAIEIYNKDLNTYEEAETEEKQKDINDKAEIHIKEIEYLNREVEHLNKQVEYLTAEIEVKNKQIAELQEQLKASSERETNYQLLLNQQQQLNGIDKQRVLQLEQETQTAKKKKGIFGVFSRKQKEDENNG